MEDYMIELYVQNHVHIGETFSLARGERTAFAMVGDNADLWTHYIYAILADPRCRCGPRRPRCPRFPTWQR
jgi:hypothetical protein